MTKEGYNDIQQKVTEIIRKRHGLARTKELLSEGITYKSILSLVADGTIVRAKSGYYTLPEGNFSEDEKIASLFPDGVLTMQTALYIHGYLNQKPADWHIAVSKNTSKSRFKGSTISLVPYYTEERVLPIGAGEYEIGGGKMRIYNIDRLICDVLKYEEKLDRNDYKAAILAYINDEKKDVAKLLSYAKERKVLKKVQSVIGVWL